MNTIADFFRHFFTPGETNNFKAKALHLDFLTYYLIFALLLVVTVKHAKSYANNILGFATDISVPKLDELTNKERSKIGLSSLTYNEKLSEAARKKADDMFAKGYWSHYSPDGATPWDFIIGAGYQYEYAGENLAKNFLFSQGVVDAWMNSPTHRDNIVKKEYTEVGFAIVNGILNGEETTLVVQMFGTPIRTNIVQAQTPPPQAVKTLDAKASLPAGHDVPAVLGKEKAAGGKINLFFVTLDTTYLFIALFSGLLLLDFYLAAKMNVVRINGKNLAHFMFLAFVMVGILFILRKGAIL